MRRILWFRTTAPLGTLCRRAHVLTRLANGLKKHRHHFKSSPSFRLSVHSTIFEQKKRRSASKTSFSSHPSHSVYKTKESLSQPQIMDSSKVLVKLVKVTRVLGRTGKFFHSLFLFIPLHLPAQLSQEASNAKQTTNNQNKGGMLGVSKCKPFQSHATNNLPFYNRFSWRCHTSTCRIHG